MKFPFLASFIIFILVLTRVIRKGRRKQEAQEQSFWDREQMANSVRRKPLDDLDYIDISLEKLTISETFLSDFTAKHPEIASNVADCRETLEMLSKERIVNLTGYTNTDLKLEYGTANITALSEYDQNYTLLVRTLQKWADLLWENGYRTEAVSVMEFAVETDTDISRSYYLLAEHYKETGNSDKIHVLIETAKSLRSANKDIIVRTLQESYL
ncbi:MAG: hypothetical protein II994_06520 [Lachnospiraceae bacterium]|nr:hypothetical protein [Lachnospiraceae bacterium]